MVLAFAVIAVLLVWPLSSIFTASFIDNTTREPTLGNYARVLGQPFFQTALVNSLIVGVGGMLGAMLLGLPLAALTTRYVIVGRNFLSTLAVLALVSPPFIGAYAWIMMLGRNGFVRVPLEELGIELPSIYGYLGIILVFSLKFYPFVFLLASSSLATINPSVEEAAEGLGAGPWRRFFDVTLPLVFPAVSAGALLTFVLSLADFGTPAIVGGKVRVLATTAYNLFTSEMTGNPGLASATSVVLIVLSMVVVALQRASVRRRNVAGNLIRKAAPKALGPLASAAAHVVCYAIVLASSLPSLVVIYTSFRKTSGPVFKPGYGLDSYARIIREVPQVISNSATYALISVALIVVARHAHRLSRRAPRFAARRPARQRAVHSLHRARRRAGPRVRRHVQREADRDHRHGDDHRPHAVHPPAALRGALERVDPEADPRQHRGGRRLARRVARARLRQDHAAADAARASSPAR